MSNVRSTAPVMLGAEDLPAMCPNPQMALWNQHPKVSIGFDAHGQGRCPYCGTIYQLKEGVGGGHH